VSDLYGPHADLYDIAFDWDVSDEAVWLRDRLGPQAHTVLEPGCGSGRMLVALARLGVAVTGIDVSEAMLQLARARLAAEGLEAEVVAADMTGFDLGRTFGGAICPINTLMHLSREQLPRHLAAMAAALEPGSRYLVQLGIVIDGDVPVSHWLAERDGMEVRVTWTPGPRERGVELHRSTIEILSGPRAGEIVEEDHPMTVWDHDGWRRAIEESGFTWVAVYDGAENGRPRIGFDATGGLLWHELARL
jgi:SAM-dependent methyltransferase